MDPDITPPVWERHQRRVLDVAYRMTGSLTDAEDIAQDVYLRLGQQDLASIDHVEAWLVTVTARRALDHLRSARISRTDYIGPWLPEPLVQLDGVDADPADRVTLDDTVRLALLIVLERLTPAERTAYLLHDVFGVPFDEIATIVGRNSAACRQLASRARRHVHEAKRDVVPSEQLRRTVDAFRRACEAGDLDGLVQILDPDATGDFDSGGLFPGAPTETITGAEPIARQLLTSFAGIPVAFLTGSINNEPGMVVTLSGRVVTVIALQVRSGRVHHIDAIGNPAKLPRTGLVSQRPRP